MKNRIIKFRVWDGIDYMSKPFTLTDIQEGKIQFTSDCIIMQSTGLLDKNGIEGFHKDIVRSGKKLFIIEWQEEEARFWLAPCADNTGSWQFMDMLKSFEIIGNVFENADLLK